MGLPYIMDRTDEVTFTDAGRISGNGSVLDDSKGREGTVDVSVVIANHNNQAYLTEFFESCLRSTVAPKEWIFVDDGSTDDSITIAKRYSSRLKNLRIVTFSENYGFANALNEGIDLAHGKFIARMDPDDILMPDRLKLQYSVLATNASDVVGCNAIYYLSDQRVDIGHTNFPNNHQTILNCFKRGELGVLHATVMAKASLFRKYRYSQENVPAEDYDVFSRMAQSGARFTNLSSLGIRYRVHQHSVSNHIRYSTIAKTYNLRDEIFGTRTGPLRVWMYFVYIWCYRRGRFAGNVASRSLYFAIAAGARPDKVVARLRKTLGLTR